MLMMTKIFCSSLVLVVASGNQFCTNEVITSEVLTNVVVTAGSTCTIRALVTGNLDVGANAAAVLDTAASRVLGGVAMATGSSLAVSAGADVGSVVGFQAALIDINVGGDANEVRCRECDAIQVFGCVNAIFLEDPAAGTLVVDGSPSGCFESAATCACSSLAPPAVGIAGGTMDVVEMKSFHTFGGASAMDKLISETHILTRLTTENVVLGDLNLDKLTCAPGALVTVGNGTRLESDLTIFGTPGDPAGCTIQLGPNFVTTSDVAVTGIPGLVLRNITTVEDYSVSQIDEVNVTFCDMDGIAIKDAGDILIEDSCFQQRLLVDNNDQVTIADTFVGSGGVSCTGSTQILIDGGGNVAAATQASLIQCPPPGGPLPGIAFTFDPTALCPL